MKTSIQESFSPFMPVLNESKKTTKSNLKISFPACYIVNIQDSSTQHGSTVTPEAAKPNLLPMPIQRRTASHYPSGGTGIRARRLSFSTMSTHQQDLGWDDSSRYGETATPFLQKLKEVQSPLDPSISLLPHSFELTKCSPILTPEQL